MKFIMKVSLYYGKKKWEQRINLNNSCLKKSLKIMRTVNPLVIPRNHLVEEALNHATEKNSLNKINELLKVLKDPYSSNSETSKYQSTQFSEKNYVTYCGT